MNTVVDAASIICWLAPASISLNWPLSPSAVTDPSTVPDVAFVCLKNTSPPIAAVPSVFILKWGTPLSMTLNVPVPSISMFKSLSACVIVVFSTKGPPSLIVLIFLFKPFSTTGTSCQVARPTASDDIKTLPTPGAPPLILICPFSSIFPSTSNISSGVVVPIPKFPFGPNILARSVLSVFIMRSWLSVVPIKWVNGVVPAFPSVFQNSSSESLMNPLRSIKIVSLEVVKLCNSFVADESLLYIPRSISFLSEIDNVSFLKLNCWESIFKSRV